MPDGGVVITLVAPVTKTDQGGAGVTLTELHLTRFKVKHLRRLDPESLSKGKVDIDTLLNIGSGLARESWAVDELECAEDLESLTEAIEILMGKFQDSRSPKTGNG